MTHEKRETPRIRWLANLAVESAAVRGAAAYDGALVRCGGRRLELASAMHNSELLVALYESPPYDLKVAPIDTPRLSINLVEASVRGRIGSDQVAVYSGRRYSLFLTPARAEVWWAKARSSRHLNIYFPETLLDEIGGGPRAVLRRDVPLFNAHVARIRPLIDAIEFSILHSEPFAGEVALGLGHLIVAELAHTPDRKRPVLAAPALTRVQDYVAAHLGRQIRVADLAALTGMSATHFTACFDAAIGCTPHRFVLQQRVDAAVRLLRCSRLALAEIAVDCGFSSQQHMATAVKQRTGVTPRKIRSI